MGLVKYAAFLMKGLPARKWVWVHASVCVLYSCILISVVFTSQRSTVVHNCLRVISTCRIERSSELVAFCDVVC